MSYLYLALLVSALGLIQCLIGGTRLLFSFPSYCILGVCGVLTLLTAFKKPKVRPDPWCLLTSIVFFGYILARAKLSPIDYMGRPDFYMVLGCLIVYFLSAFYLTSSRDRLIVVGSLFVVVLLHVFVGTIQFTQSNGFMLFGFSRGDVSSRASGLFISGNHFAGFVEAMGVIGLSLAWWSRWPIWGKILVGYLALACYFGVAISESRGGMLSSVFSILVLCGFGLAVVRRLDRDKFVRSAFVCMVVLAAGVGGAGFLALHSQAIRMRLGQEHMKDVRRYNWQATLDQFRVSPVFGTGAGTHLYYGRLFRRPQIQADPVHAHSDYLELLAEYGVVGEMGMVLFIIVHLRSGFRGFDSLVTRLRGSYLPRSNGLALNIGILCAVFGLLAHSVVDFNMHIPANALVFAFFFGVLASPGAGQKREGQRFEVVMSGARFALPALGAAVCLLAIPRYPGEYFAEKCRVALRDKLFMDSIGFGKRALAEQVDSSSWLDRLNQWAGGEKRNPQIYFYIGEAYRGMGMGFSSKVLSKMYLNPAIGAYQKALSIFPQDEHTLVRMAQCYDHLGLFDEAEDAFSKAIQVDPNLGVIFEFYATHLKLQGKTADLGEISRKAKELTKGSLLEAGGGDWETK